MPRRWKAAIFLTTLLAATLSFATFASARTDHVTVLHFTARQVELHFVDVAPHRRPAVARRHLRGQRRPVSQRPQGRLQRRYLSCRAHPARPGRVPVRATAHLDQGDLTVQGLACQQPTNVFGITGGTGRWRNAGGQVVVQDVLQPTSQITAYITDLGQGHS
jgi:hypothetical protein